MGRMARRSEVAARQTALAVAGLHPDGQPDATM